ncbi:MAG: flagellar M-ring protein FliF [Rhodospirillaceae bacterium TMED8]|nr:flagellar M-ring protein FliF [Magnetovibrio sp.]OUT50096.1 MAG: flagellar M-ring protein FliF [Rhodospirillaceae bacterium TMED8]
MKTIAKAFQNIGPIRLAIMGGVITGLIAFFIFLVTSISSPEMQRLYGELEKADSNKIAVELSTLGIKHEVKKNGAEVYVPVTQADRALLHLADKGLPGGGTIGYEIFDKQESLGTTNFMQNVNLVRALEGELAKTIQTISTVKSARIHLVMPKRQLFSRQKQQPSASVVLSMKSAQRLNPEQVNAIQHLVATAVPELNPSRISVVDNKGKLLAGAFENEDSPAAMALKADQRRRSLEARLSRTVEELLEKTAGFGKVRAEVNVEMDFDRVSTKEETYDPDGQVVRSTQTVEQTASNRDTEGQTAVTVGTNLPDPNLNNGDTTSSSANETRTEETVNFEISKTIKNHVREAGIIKRLSVAVLIDGKRVTDKDGQLKYEPRNDAEMELLATLVRGAIGFNADRGDTVEVINMEFAEFLPPDTPLDLLIFGLTKNDAFKFAELFVYIIVALLVILMVIRPLISRALEVMPSAKAEPLLADHVSGRPALAGPGGTGIPAPSELSSEEEHFEELIDIDRVEGRVKASSVKKVGEIVDKHPEEALSIIRSWMHQEAPG